MIHAEKQTVNTNKQLSAPPLRAQAEMAGLLLTEGKGELELLAAVEGLEEEEEQVGGAGCASVYLFHLIVCNSV